MDSGKFPEEREIVGRRVEFINLLEERGEMATRDIVDAVDHSRSTVTRALRELGDAGLIENTDDGYRATIPGLLAAAEYKTFVTSTDAILSSKELLEPIPTSDAPPAELLRGATTFLAEDAAPFRPLEEVSAMVGDADTIVAYFPTLINPHLLKIWANRLGEADIDSFAYFDGDLLSLLKGQYPELLSTMASTDSFAANISSGPRYGIVVTENAGAKTVALLVYEGDTGIRGVLTNDSPAAVSWANERFAELEAEANPVTADLASLVGAVEDGVPELQLGHVDEQDTDPVERDGGFAGHALPLALEEEGFTRLSREFFRSHEQSNPRISLQTGLTLPEVRAGHAVDRLDDSGQNLVESLIDTLGEGDDSVLLGPPGAGKSTVCMSVACDWYERHEGPVIYRERGRGEEFESNATLEAYLRQTEGHALVVVEDAIRREANAIFGVMRTLASREDVTFLLDSRQEEWRNPEEYDLDHRDDSYRSTSINQVTMPEFGEDDCQRFVSHAEELLGRDSPISGKQLVESIREGISSIEGQSKPGEALLVQNFLFRRLDSENGNEVPKTEFEAAIRESYECLLDGDRETAADLALLVNIINAAGIPVAEEYLYAIAPDGDYGTVEAGINKLEGRHIFRQEATRRRETQIRTHHEVWSTSFLEQVMEVLGTYKARKTFGEIVTDFLSLADDGKRRERIKRHVGNSPHLHRIEADPSNWADEVAERLFMVGVNHSSLAPLFGKSGGVIELPRSCSDRLHDEQHYWRAKMCRKQANLEQGLAELKPILNKEVNQCKSGSDTKRELTMRASLEAARIHSYMEQMDRAREFYHRTKSIGANLGRKQAQADALCGLASIERRHANFNKAIRYNRRAFELSEANEIQRTKAQSLRGLALIRYALGEYGRGKTLHEQAAAAAEKSGDEQIRTASLGSMSIFAAKTGSFENAHELLSEVKRVSREYGYTLGKINAAIWEGNYLRMAGEISEAESSLDEAQRMISQTNVPFVRANLQLQLGQLEFDRGNHEAAREHVQKSLEISSGEKWETSSFGHKLLARIAIQQGKFDSAEDHISRGRTTPGNLTVNEYDLVESWLAYQQGDLTRAVDLARKAEEPNREQGFPREVALALRTIGIVIAEWGDTERARTVLEESLEKAQESQVKRTIAEVHAALARFEHQYGRSEESEIHLQHATEIFDLLWDDHRRRNLESEVKVT